VFIEVKTGESAALTAKQTVGFPAISAGDWLSPGVVDTDLMLPLGSLA
jgi:hypothetical protein